MPDLLIYYFITTSIKRDYLTSIKMKSHQNTKALFKIPPKGLVTPLVPKDC